MPTPAARSAGGALRKPYKPLAMELQYPRPMLSTKPRLPDPDAIALPPIGDDPAYQAALVELVAPGTPPGRDRAAAQNAPRQGCKGQRRAAARWRGREICWPAAP